MSSSTFSFSKGSIILVVIVSSIILSEITFRTIVGKLSGNLEHIEAIPEISGHISESDQSIVFLGNSLTYNGINIDEFESSLQSYGINIHNTFKITPDGTDLWDWYLLSRHQLMNLPNPPDILIIGFAWKIMSDQRPPNLSRLGGSFGTLKDVGELWKNGVRDVGSLSKYILAYYLKIFSHRDTLRNRFFDFFVPSYREATRRINTSQQRFAPQYGDNTAEIITYDRLKSFIQQLKERQIVPLFIAMPVQEPYGIDTSLKEAVSSTGALFWDCRSIEGITKNTFFDTMHLNTRGSKILSRHLATLFAQNRPALLQKK